ncbi:hypothetical protein ACFWBN_36005 [Streptomyces sp. NPDC059989]|uniref:hypothetical protein n=1 Tax=Streptomyces sp. NPDC059989 TaxID=3347026 RepID=UPI003694FA6D
MSPRKILTMMTATAALIAGSVLTTQASAAPQSPQSASASASTYKQQAIGAGLTGPQATELQRKVDEVLAKDSKARQVSANKLMISGGSLTLAAPGQRQARDLAAPDAALACDNGHLCITDGRGSYYDYYYCGYYDFWGIGDGTFNNNQTWGTRARFYNENGSERWSNVAKATGTASWTPVYHIRPC